MYKSQTLLIFNCKYKTFISSKQKMEVLNRVWTEFTTELSSTFAAAENSYKNFWPLIVYLEEATMQSDNSIVKPEK